MKRKSALFLSTAFVWTLLTSLLTMSAAAKPVRIEETDLTVEDSSDRAAYYQSGLCPEWENGQHIVWASAAVGDVWTLSFPVETAGEYVLAVNFTTHSDFGIARASVNGSPAGNPVDCYRPAAEGIGVTLVEFGPLRLEQGANTLTLEITGKNDESTAYFLGVDYLELRIPGEEVPDPVVIACVGDSITAGHGASGAEKSYPGQLQALLGEGFLVKNFGVSGTTMLETGDSPYVRTGHYEASLHCDPDVVLIMLGTNDCSPANRDKLENFLDDAVALIEAYQSLPSCPEVYLMTSPALYPNGVGYNDTVLSGEIVSLQRRAAAETGCRLMEVNALTTRRASWFGDGIHPNDTGYAQIAAFVRNSLSFRVEESALTVTENSGRAAYIQSGLCPEWWNGQHIVWASEAVGDVLSVNFEAPVEAAYTLSVQLTQNYDFGMVQLSINGRPLGEPVDCYVPPEEGTTVIEKTVTGVSLKKGTNTLTLEVTGKNSDALAYYLGVDCLRLTPFDGLSAAQTAVACELDQAKDLALYRPAQRQAIADKTEEGRTSISGAESINDVYRIRAQILAALDEIPTAAELDAQEAEQALIQAKADAVAALDDMAAGADSLSEEQRVTLAAAIEKGKAAVTVASDRESVAAVLRQTEARVAEILAGQPTVAVTTATTSPTTVILGNTSVVSTTALGPVSAPKTGHAFPGALLLVCAALLGLIGVVGPASKH